MTNTLIRDLPPGRYGIGCPARFFHPRTWEEFDTEIRLRNMLTFIWTRPAAIYYVGRHGACEFEIDEPGKDTVTLHGEIGSGQIGAIPMEVVEFNGAQSGGCIVYEFKHPFNAEYRRPTIRFWNTFGEDVSVHLG